MPLKPVFFNKSFCYFWKVKKETSEACSNSFFLEGGGWVLEGWDLRVGATQQKCGYCYSYLISLETVFAARKLAQNYYKYIFFLKTGDLVLANWEQFGSTN